MLCDTGVLCDVLEASFLYISPTIPVDSVQVAISSDEAREPAAGELSKRRHAPHPCLAGSLARVAVTRSPRWIA